VGQAADRAAWRQFTRPAFQLQFRYPPVTPQGRLVDVAEKDLDDAMLVHLTARSRDRRLISS
jgi:hypothetical protein